MAEAYIIEAVRTPAGRRGGELSRVHPADLGAHVITALLNRVDVDPTDVDDVIFGCVDTVGPQAGDIARTSWLAAGFPEQVPGVTVDRQCGSSQQALHFAAQAVMSGTADVVVAGGVQNMSQVPIGSAMTAGSQTASPFEGCEGWQHRYGDEEVSQFRAADLIAVRWDLSRREMEEFALQSHLRAITAIKEGRFDREIAPVNGVAADECPRPDTSAEKMAKLPPLRPGGRTTAALSSQISDGASAVLVVSERAVREHRLTPRARVHHMSARGSDPIYMLTAPIRATKYALDRAGMALSDIDLFEINEAFASVALAWAKELKIDLGRVNVNGGALALGHPIGATGTKLFTTLLHELERSGGRYGLQTMCEGGGQANVTIIERL
ncbi:acetyl-CoA C-acetyltransferase [Lentzea sp.]|uniref:acetyl-CoA C-acetyltransferase n=1 Tax=Lentzea sp. TaxID=56099 RepID=UPI002B54BA0A|nr:acetyl-CoA C-acetyltransferase [Lentzea sp.]HUQ55848.1 acetyl-CoA C-acetyltransferase [Lentzea sp.]